MSKYTTELRYLIESGFDIGLKDYPLYQFKNINMDIDYRTLLNNKIIEHYAFREIGLETPTLFKKFLNRKMNEIMPYYNQLYKSCDIEFNPLWNVEMHETFTHSVEDNGKTTNKGNTTLNSSQQNNVETNTNSNISRDNNNTTKNETLSNNDLIAVTQDTPQSMLTDDDIKQNMYASKTQYDKTSNNGSSSTDIDISENTNEETKNSTDSQNVTNENQNSSHETDNINKRTETYTRLQEGSSAGLPYSDAIKQWRNIMVNIDMMVIDELEQLFMQIW